MPWLLRLLSIGIREASANKCIGCGPTGTPLDTFAVVDFINCKIHFTI